MQSAEPVEERECPWDDGSKPGLGRAKFRPGGLRLACVMALALWTEMMPVHLHGKTPAVPFGLRDSKGSV
jgi:hypothetical protein